MSNFKLGSRSLRKLSGTHNDIQKLVKVAIKHTEVDFGVTEGLRSRERQKILKATGKSQTLNSPHIKGCAVDVIAYKGKYTYEPFSLFTEIAEGFRKASLETGIPVTWGAAWLAPLSYYDSAEEALDHYKKVRRNQGRKVFLDGVHFELDRKTYGW